MTRLLRFVGSLLVVAGAMAGPALGQRTEFEPRLFLYGSYSDNVGVVETTDATGASTDTSDQYTDLGVELPVTRTMRFGSLGFTYAGVYSRYDSNTVYDNFSHSAVFNVTPRLGRGATLSAELFYSLSQQQGTSRSIDDDEQFLTVRTDRTFYGARLQYNKDSRRSAWVVGLRGTRSEFDPIEGTLPAPGPPDPQAVALFPENRTYWYGNIEYRRKLSRRFSLGPRYDVGYSQLERNGTELFHVLSAAFGWEVSQYFSFDAAVGASRRTSEGDEIAGTKPPAETGLAWILTLRIDPPLAAIQSGKIKLGLDIGISPSGGGALQGTSTNSYVRLYLASGTRRSRWSWEVGTRYTRRDSTLETQPTVETAGLEGSVDYGIGSLVSLSLGVGWSEQLNADSGTTNGAVGTARAGVVLYPRGKASSGRR